MSTNQSSLIKKLSASAQGVCPEGAAHELKKIQAALRGDFAAVSFLLLKELEELRGRFSAVHEELAEAEEEVAGRRDADEKNHALYTKTRKQLSIYKSLHSSNAATYGKLFKENQDLKEEIAGLERFTEKCSERNGDIHEQADELRQHLGYKTVQLEEAQRTIKGLEEVIAHLSK
jgi:chromosome segregation ATPase